MNTRREFIKILTGTVIAISLPIGLFSDNTIMSSIKQKDFKFTITRVEIVPLPVLSGYLHAFTMVAVLDSDRSKACFIAMGVDDANDYDRELYIKEAKYQIREFFIDKLNKGR